jgi:hypothetical protein
MVERPGVAKISTIEIDQGRVCDAFALWKSDGSSLRSPALALILPHHPIALDLLEDFQRIQVYAHFSNEAFIVIFLLHVLEEDVALLDFDGRCPSGRRPSLDLAVLSQENGRGIGAPN